MRERPRRYIEENRISEGFYGSTFKFGCNGAFRFGPIVVIASDGTAAPEGLEGWEHVSASHPNRCPTWSEMCAIKDMFWRGDETVIQFHPPEKAHVNIQPNCLHMWRKIDGMIETPPMLLV